MKIQAGHFKSTFGGRRFAFSPYSSGQHLHRLFTPTEAAAVSAVYAFIIAIFIYKDLRWSHILKVLLDSANMSAMLLYIITNAILFHSC